MYINVDIQNMITFHGHQQGKGSLAQNIPKPRFRLLPLRPHQI